MDGLTEDEEKSEPTPLLPLTFLKLDPNDLVEFVPEFLPNLYINHAYDDKVEHRSKFMLDVDFNQCWLTIGVINKVNRVFYDRYMELRADALAAEKYRHDGPPKAPWMTVKGWSRGWNYVPSSDFHILPYGRTGITSGIVMDEVTRILMTKEEYEWLVRSRAASKLVVDNAIKSVEDLRMKMPNPSKKPTKLERIVQKLKGKKK